MGYTELKQRTVDARNRAGGKLLEYALVVGLAVAAYNYFTAPNHKHLISLHRGSHEHAAVYHSPKQREPDIHVNLTKLFHLDRK